MTHCAKLLKRSKSALLRDHVQPDRRGEADPFGGQNHAHMK